MGTAFVAMGIASLHHIDPHMTMNGRPVETTAQKIEWIIGSAGIGLDGISFVVAHRRKRI
jgi:hypothetical protein